MRPAHAEMMADGSAAPERLRLMQLCGLDYGFYMHLLPLARWCEQVGFEIVCCGPPGSFHRQIIAQGHRYVEVPFSRDLDPINHWRCLGALRAVMRRERIDIVHSHSLLGGLLGRIAARQVGVPLSIYTAHGFRFHPDQNAVAHRFYLEVERVGARYTDFLFTQNREDRAAAIHFGLSREERVLAIGNGVDLARFRRGGISARALDRLRADLSIPEGATVITAIGRPTAEKGAADFIEMARQVTRQRRNVWFIAVLPSIANERHSIRASLVRRADVPNLRILDYRQDIPELLALTDVYVLASQYEGLSRSLMEAMVSGAAPVVSDVRGNREMVRHGDTGLIAAYGDLPRFVAHLLLLADDPPHRAAMGRKAREFAEQNFDERVMLREQMRVLRRLACERFAARAQSTLCEV